MKRVHRIDLTGTFWAFIHVAVFVAYFLAARAIVDVF